MRVKDTPNEHEKALFARAEKYIKRITWIPWLRMIAVVNSLSMYATHAESDIDLFVVTSRGTLWFVRVLMTAIFWMQGVWRHGENVSWLFCLSFFVEEDSLDMDTIALENDVYLAFWMYYMKPIFVVWDIWEQWKEKNPVYSEKAIVSSKKESFPLWKIPLKRARPVPWEYFAKILNIIIKPFWEWRAQKSFRQKWKPEWVIIASGMLKFHDRDRRREIREQIICAKEKNH